MVLPEVERRGPLEAWIIDDTGFPKRGRHSVGVSRANVTTLGLSYVAGIMPNTTVWAPGTGPPPPKKWSGQGLSLPANAWRTIKWREGSADRLSSRFARLRVRVAHRDYNLTESRPEEWLLIEWPEEGRERADQILALDPCRRHRPPSSGRPRQAALAHRTRLSATQAGGRDRAFRGAWLARIPSPRHPMHRRLRIPDRRAGSNSPLRTSFYHAVPGTCRTRRLPTQRIRRDDPSVTSQTRSQPCVDD